MRDAREQGAELRRRRSAARARRHVLPADAAHRHPLRHGDDRSRRRSGPVAGITRFADEREAIDLANDTPYGLAAFFYSRDIGRIWRVSEGLETGIVGINTGFISNEVSPFGGVKESGIGREGSKYGIEEWLEVKYLCMGGI